MASLFLAIKGRLYNHKLTRDIAWSMSSFFVLAISGIVINIAITGLRNASALGIFNLSYAVYIVISQFAVWGIHYSVLRYAAYFKESPAERDSMLYTASVLALFLGGVAAGLTALAEPLFTWIFTSPQTAAAIRNSTLGLLLFPLNKVLLAYLNGLREMKTFSILQGIRYFTVMVTVTVIALSPLPIELSTLGFFVAEALTLFGAIIILIKKRLITRCKFSLDWMRKHFIFGSKGLLAGMFAEINARVDVLMIGFFLDARATGIYSFAAMLVDGLYHVLAMIRINFNPVLVAAVRDNDWAQAVRLRNQSKKYVLPVVFSLSIALVAAYYVLATWIMPDKGLMLGMPPLLILLFGLNLVSILIPFDNLMVVSGHPGFQATQHMFTVSSNALVAALFIPVMGIEGAALGTAISYCCGITLLIIFSHRMLGWRLISNKAPQSKSKG